MTSATTAAATTAAVAKISINYDFFRNVLCHGGAINPNRLKSFIEKVCKPIYREMLVMSDGVLFPHINLYRSLFDTCDIPFLKNFGVAQGRNVYLNVSSAWLGLMCVACLRYSTPKYYERLHSLCILPLTDGCVDTKKPSDIFLRYQFATLAQHLEFYADIANMVQKEVIVQHCTHCVLYWTIGLIVQPGDIELFNLVRVLLAQPILGYTICTGPFKIPQANEVCMIVKKFFGETCGIHPGQINPRNDARPYFMLCRFIHAITVFSGKEPVYKLPSPDMIDAGFGKYLAGHEGQIPINYAAINAELIKSCPGVTPAIVSDMSTLLVDDLSEFVERTEYYSPGIISECKVRFQELKATKHFRGSKLVSEPFVSSSSSSSSVPPSFKLNPDDFEPLKKK
jgi:hypothetical protein